MYGAQITPLSRLEYDPSVNVKSVHWSERWCYFAILLAHYDPKDPVQMYGRDPCSARKTVKT